MNYNLSHLTKTSEKILQILENSEIPLTVYQISDRAKLPVPSVYRNVAFLEKRELLNSFQVGGFRHYYPRKKHLHYFICDDCGDIRPIRSCEISNSQAENSIGCKVTEHILIFRGLCKNCLQKEGQR